MRIKPDPSCNRGIKMDEKRKHKRLGIEVQVETERIDVGNTTTVKYLTVEITDISKSGIGFKCAEEFEDGATFIGNITIWTKEVIPAIFKIVRRSNESDGWHYGCIFVGMKESEVLKIQIYEMLND